MTRFEPNGEQYDVFVQVAPRTALPRDVVDHLRARSRRRDGAAANLVRSSRGSRQPVNHFNRLRAVTVSANACAGLRSIGDATGRSFDADGGEGNARSTAQTDVNGQSREFRSRGAKVYAFVFVLALGFIYLVLAAQFESFRDPLIILITVPLSMTGALGAPWLTGGTLNVFSQIGLVTLVGLITKHGILIVEFANQLQEKGRDRLNAAIEAAGLRLRPILMTTGAMVLGALPLALASGAGAEVGNRSAG